jgi:hypothetical protein
MGITILAVLSAIGGVFGVIEGFAVMAIAGTIFGGAGFILGLALIAWAALSIALAWGFWTLQPWAWPLGVVLEVAGIVLGVLQYLGNASSITSLAITIVISGVILYYLFQPPIKALFGR